MEVNTEELLARAKEQSEQVTFELSDMVATLCRGFDPDILIPAVMSVGIEVAERSGGEMRAHTGRFLREMADMLLSGESPKPSEEE